MTTWICPFCRAKLNIRESQIGQILPCAICKTESKVEVFDSFFVSVADRDLSDTIFARMFAVVPPNVPVGFKLVPAIVTEPPWELAGAVLTDLVTDNFWLFQRLPRVLHDCVNGIRTTFSGGTECYVLDVQDQVVRLQETQAHPILRCEVPLKPFFELFLAWDGYVRCCKRSTTKTAFKKVKSSKLD